MTLTQDQLQELEINPKAFLSRGFTANKMIAAKRDRIADWRMLSESITVQLRLDGGSGSRYKQSLVENAICAIDGLENEIIEEIKALTDIQKEITCVISELLEDTKLKAIIELRYLNSFSWEVIASTLYYGRDWVCRLHGSALHEIKASAKRSRFKSVQSAL